MAAEVLERGGVHFFYRPRVERHEARGEDDVQRFIVVLAPEGRRLFRLVLVGRKRLPDVALRGRDRNWAWVARVTGDAADLEEELRGYRYPTKTRGEREQPPARPAGDGEYVLARHRDHTHLAYALLRPDPPGPVQRELGIAASASFIAAAKNPEWPSRPRVGLADEQTAWYPRDVQERFRGRRWGELEPAHLDRDGAEILLVGATEDPEAELGVTLEADDRAPTPDAFRALGLDRRNHPAEPLFRGEWA